MYNSQISKILTIIALNLIIISLLIMFFTPGATKYEISTYNAYPIYFWFLIIISIILGEIILLKNIKEKDDDYWLLGSGIIIFSNILLLFIPIIRGYVIFGREDVLSHFGFIKEILIQGHIGTTNMYPVNHILAVFNHLILNLELSMIVNIIPIIFSVFYIISFYLLIKEFFNKTHLIIIGMSLALILLLGHFHNFYAPYSQALLFLPFIIYIYLKSRTSEPKIQFSILLVILTLLLIFFHPLITLIIICIFLIAEISKLVEKKINPNSNYKFKNALYLVIISIIGFFSWSAYSLYLIKSLQKILNWFIGEKDQTSLFQTYIESVSNVNPSVFSIINSIFYNYGQNIILGIFSLIGILYVLKGVNLKELEFKHLFSFFGFLTFFLISMIALIQPYIFSYVRILPILSLFSILIIVSSLEILEKLNSIKYTNTFKVFFVIFLILPISYFATFNLFYSPITKTPNQQVSQAEIVGMQTFFEQRNESKRIMELGISQLRFYDMLYGNMSRDNLYYIPTKTILYGESAKPPDNFNLFENSSMEFKNRYLIISRLGIIFYPEIYPEYSQSWKFTPDDFKKLNDSNILFISDNGNLKIYLIE